VTTREAKALEVVAALDVLATWREKLTRYHTTATSCGCADYLYRGARLDWPCKHMEAMRLLAERKQEDSE
jgi:hypothetical protein